MHAAEMLDHVADPAHLKCWTGVDPEKFTLMLGLYVEAIECMGVTPLFKNCPSIASNRGNRCKLEYEHTLYLSPVRIMTSLTQEHLAHTFGADRSAVCMYLRLNERVMDEVLPTPKNTSREIAACKTDEERKKFMPGKKGGDLVIDGTRALRARHSDEAEQREYYTRKNKTHCTNTLTVTNRKTATARVSETLPGSRNDIVMLGGGLAEAFPSMADPDTPEKKGMRLIGDSGFQGSEKRLPGIIPVNPGRLRCYSPRARHPGRQIALLFSEGATSGPADCAVILRGRDIRAGRLRCYSPRARHPGRQIALLFSEGATSGPRGVGSRRNEPNA